MDQEERERLADVKKRIDGWFGRMDEAIEQMEIESMSRSEFYDHYNFLRS